MKDAPVATVESSAFFIRDHHDNEVIVFGDIEPDSISLDRATSEFGMSQHPRLLPAIYVQFLLNALMMIPLKTALSMATFALVI